MYGQYCENGGRRWTVRETRENTRGAKVRKAGYNRFIVEYPDGRRAYRVHSTDVVSIKGRTVTFDDGGWRTKLTHRAMRDGFVALTGLHANISAGKRKAHALWALDGYPEVEFNAPFKLRLSK